MAFKAFDSLVCRDIIAIDDMDLIYHGSADDWKYRQVADVTEGMMSLDGQPLVELHTDVDL